jgi:hypothetical protein
MSTDGVYTGAQFAVINASASGDNTIVAAITSHRIIVLNYVLSAAGAVNGTWKDGAVAVTGLETLPAAGSSLAVVGNLDSPLFRTTSGNALVLNLSAAVAVGGHITFVTEAVPGT